MIGYLILSRIYFILKEIDKNDRTKYVSKDEEMNAIVCHDLKAAYVKNGKVFVGGVLK